MILSVGVVVTWFSNPRGGCRKLPVRTENSNRLHTRDGGTLEGDAAL